MSCRTAIYIRTSSETQGGKASPSEQEVDCQTLAREKGLQVVRVYRDVEKYRVGNKLLEPSGSRSDRPALQAMLKDAARDEFAPKILEIAKSSIQNGQPIIRPIFWLDPDDERALACDDEFLLGDEFLVAPVVTPNTIQRDVYLPIGEWQNYWTKEIFTGRTLLKDYPTPLDVLPIFKKINDGGIHDSL